MYNKHIWNAFVVKASGDYSNTKSIQMEYICRRNEEGNPKEALPRSIPYIVNARAIGSIWAATDFHLDNEYKSMCTHKQNRDNKAHTCRAFSIYIYQHTYTARRHSNLAYSRTTNVQLFCISVLAQT